MPDEKIEGQSQADDQNRIQRISYPLDPSSDQIEEVEGRAAGNGQVEITKMPFQGR
jgi:hypothetical protein